MQVSHSENEIYYMKSPHSTEELSIQYKDYSILEEQELMMRVGISHSLLKLEYSVLGLFIYVMIEQADTEAATAILKALYTARNI